MNEISPAVNGTESAPPPPVVPQKPRRAAPDRPKLTSAQRDRTVLERITAMHADMAELDDYLRTREQHDPRIGLLLCTLSGGLVAGGIVLAAARMGWL